MVNNTLPRCELVVYNEWWWTASCEYCDIVYGVDSWMEFKHPDMTASNTNPFVQIYPRTPAKRAFSTISDNETYLGVARELDQTHRRQALRGHVALHRREAGGCVPPTHHRRLDAIARLSDRRP